MNRQDHPLKIAALKILEDWAMMMVDEVSEINPALFDREQDFFISWVKLDGPIHGSVKIVAQKPFMRNLFHNVLGEDAIIDSEESEYKDAFREMCNVLAGTFTTEAYGDEVVFDLLNPRVDQISFEELEEFTRLNVVFCFIADDAPVAVSFDIEKRD